MSSLTRIGRASIALVVLAGVVWLTAGCFESETPVGPVAQAVVDLRLVGDWKASSGEGEPVDLTVRNFNGKEFYAELREPAEPADRYCAHVIDLKGGSFVHLRELQDDGTLPTKYLIMRVDRVDDGKVHLRHLDPEFFAEKPHDTPERLRALVEKNLDNGSMYTGDPIVLTRVKPAEQPK